ncbi:MAG: ribosome maturation factor RimP [Myxococcales bacterium]|nr:ribosome maturation factor RimP [Myxococcales bacterium]
MTLEWPVSFGHGARLRVDVSQLRSELEPLVTPHGLDLVAIEWLQGNGRGILRLYIDLPGGDPRVLPSAERPGVAADQCVAVSRDVSAHLDTVDAIELAYDLEVSSPGFERPLQKREDFDRFQGLTVRLKLRQALDGKLAFEAPLAGTAATAPGAKHGPWAVRVTAKEGVVEVPVGLIARAKLAEIKAPPKVRPGKARASDTKKNPKSPKAPVGAEGT